MGKSSLFVVPFIGFLWWASDFIGLSRNWKSDESKLKRSYALQHMYHAMGVPYVLKVFPEGTRWSQKKLEDSQAFARSRGWPELQHLLCPRTKGIWSGFSFLSLIALSCFILQKVHFE